MPDSFNIGIVGDSYGAGEGAPDDYFELDEDNSDMWISCKCHRSVRSGHLKAVKQFINEYPEIATDYSFQACSGATTQDLFSRDQVTNDYIPGTALYTNNCGNVENTKQFKRIRDVLITDRKHNEVNMLIMSIGGNNSGFGDLVIKYLLSPINLADVNAAGNLVSIDILSAYHDEIDELRNDYADLDQGISEFFPEVKPIVGLTNYPDPTKGPDGMCGCRIVDCALYENDCRHSPRAEYQLIKDEFLDPLNAKLQTEADRQGWNLIDVSRTVGIHGLCNCDEPYFNTIEATYDDQGDIYGVIHPNRKGYKEIYQEKVFNFIVTKYNDYKASYQLAILFGIKEAPSACANNRVIDLGNLLSVMNRLKGVNPAFRSLKGFEGITAELNDKQLSAIISEGNESALESNPAYQRIKNNAAYRSAFGNLAVKRSIVKTPERKSISSTVKPLNPLLSKLKADISAYTKTPEFKKRMDSKKKIAIKEKPAKDMLDNMYNNKEN